MVFSRVFHRACTTAFRSSSFISRNQTKVLSKQFPLLYRDTCAARSSCVLQQFGFCSSTSPNPTDKENTSGSASAEPQKTKDSDSDAEAELTVADLKKLVVEKEELVIAKQKEIEAMQDKFLRAYAEMENVKDRTKRDAENSKKFAIQSFAKSLLDVADNLGRASSVAKEGFAKIDTSKDSGGAVPLLKTLLEGVEMTEKQLAEVFRKFGVEKFDPVNEAFDPNKHNAVFQVPDGTRPPGTVAHVLKAGYTLYDRIIRPAEVGVTQEVEKEETENKTPDKEGMKDDAADKDSKA